MMNIFMQPLGGNENTTLAAIVLERGNAFVHETYLPTVLKPAFSLPAGVN